MKVLCYILGFGMLVFALLYADSCSRLRDSTLTAQAIRSVWEADKTMADSSMAKLSRKLDTMAKTQARKDSVHGANNAAQTMVIHKLRRKEKLSRVDTVLLTLVDTLNAETDKLLDSLESQIAGLKEADSVKSVLHAKQLEIQDKLIAVCDSLMKEIRIPPKPSRLSFGATGGVTVLVRNGEVLAGPGATMGIQYTIPIKINLRKLFRKR